MVPFLLGRKNVASYLSAVLSHNTSTSPGLIDRGARGSPITYLRCRSSRGNRRKVGGRRHNAAVHCTGESFDRLEIEIYESTVRATLHPGNFPATNLDRLFLAGEGEVSCQTAEHFFFFNKIFIQM